MREDVLEVEQEASLLHDGALELLVELLGLPALEALGHGALLPLGLGAAAPQQLVARAQPREVAVERAHLPAQRQHLALLARALLPRVQRVLHAAPRLAVLHRVVRHQLHEVAQRRLQQRAGVLALALALGRLLPLEQRRGLLRVGRRQRRQVGAVQHQQVQLVELHSGRKRGTAGAGAIRAGVYGGRAAHDDGEGRPGTGAARNCGDAYKRQAKGNAITFRC